MNIRCVHYVYTYMIYIQNEHLHIYLRLSNTYTSPCTYSLIRDEHIHTDMHNIHAYKAANIVRQEHICKRSFAYASKVYTHTYTKHRYTTATTRTTSSTHMSTHTYAPINIYMLNKTQTNAQERIHTRRLIHKHRPFHIRRQAHTHRPMHTRWTVHTPSPPTHNTFTSAKTYMLTHSYTLISMHIHRSRHTRRTIHIYIKIYQYTQTDHYIHRLIYTR